MASAVRYIASDTQAEIIKQHTRPSSLVKITFGNVTLLLCEGADILWGSDLYIGSSVRVGSFKWTPDGDHSGEVVLMNDRSDASALIHSCRTCTDGSQAIWAASVLTDNSWRMPAIVLAASTRTVAS